MDADVLTNMLKASLENSGAVLRQLVETLEQVKALRAEVAKLQEQMLRVERHPDTVRYLN
ncbi:MAG TPA: hypothetical protein VE396_11755 [Xanthobacteraceae bacterium]|nr:hypothetical protein [Xanthobacteraceae bacterium]